jgi:hypothetical protein
MGSIHVRQLREQLRLIGINILFRAHVVQGTMRPDMVIDPFSGSKGFVERLQIRLRLMESIELFQMSAVSSFDTTIQSYNLI